MKEDFCSFEVAKLLKEKGLDTKFVFFYRTDEEGKYIHHANTLQPISYKIADDEVVAAITHQMAMKWLREVHNILIVVSITYEKERYDWYICGIKGDPWEKKLFHEEKDVTYTTYEEAVEAALKHCLTELI